LADTAALFSSVSKSRDTLLHRPASATKAERKRQKGKHNYFENIRKREKKNERGFKKTRIKKRKSGIGAFTGGFGGVRTAVLHEESHLKARSRESKGENKSREVSP